MSTVSDNIAYEVNIPSREIPYEVNILSQGAMSETKERKPKFYVVEPILNDWTIMDILDKHPYPFGWETVFKNILPELRDISEIVEKFKKEGNTIYPDMCDIFRAFELVRPENVRVIIVGQDPYPQHGKCGYPLATGLSFSVRKGEKIPGSLNNVFRELKDNVPDIGPLNHGDISRWSKEEGVLLLNMSLTVNAGSPGSHKSIWLAVVKAVIGYFNENKNDVVYLLWGRKAQSLSEYINNKIVVYQAGHPSTMNTNYEQFAGCQHFAKVNHLFKTRNQPLINWNINPQPGDSSY